MVKSCFYCIVLLLVLTSCSSRFMKYESFWIIEKFEVNGEDATSMILIYNFSINVKMSSATPPTVQDDPNIRRKVMHCDIDFYRKGGKDYIQIFDHYFFEGDYEIKCLDENCCRVTIENDKIYLELKYNGDSPPFFEKSRKCP